MKLKLLKLQKIDKKAYKIKAKDLKNSYKKTDEILYY